MDENKYLAGMNGGTLFLQERCSFQHDLHFKKSNEKDYSLGTMTRAYEIGQDAFYYDKSRFENQLDVSKRLKYALGNAYAMATKSKDCIVVVLKELCLLEIKDKENYPTPDSFTANFKVKEMAMTYIDCKGDRNSLFDNEKITENWENLKVTNKPVSKSFCKFISKDIPAANSHTDQVDFKVNCTVSERNQPENGKTINSKIDLVHELDEPKIKDFHVKLHSQHEFHIKCLLQKLCFYSKNILQKSEMQVKTLQRYYHEERTNSSDTKGAIDEKYERDEDDRNERGEDEDDRNERDEDEDDRNERGEDEDDRNESGEDEDERSEDYRNEEERNNNDEEDKGDDDSNDERGKDEDNSNDESEEEEESGEEDEEVEDEESDEVVEDEESEEEDEERSIDEYIEDCSKDVYVEERSEDENAEECSKIEKINEDILSTDKNAEIKESKKQTLETRREKDNSRENEKLSFIEPSNSASNRSQSFADKKKSYAERYPSLMPPKKVVPAKESKDQSHPDMETETNRDRKQTLNKYLAKRETSAEKYPSIASPLKSIYTRLSKNQDHPDMEPMAYKDIKQTSIKSEDSSIRNKSKRLVGEKLSTYSRTRRFRIPERIERKIEGSGRGEYTELSDRLVDIDRKENMTEQEKTLEMTDLFINTLMPNWIRSPRSFQNQAEQNSERQKLDNTEKSETITKPVLNKGKKKKTRKRKKDYIEMEKASAKQFKEIYEASHSQSLVGNETKVATTKDSKSKAAKDKLKTGKKNDCVMHVEEKSSKSKMVFHKPLDQDHEPSIVSKKSKPEKQNEGYAASISEFETFYQPTSEAEKKALDEKWGTWQILVQSAHTENTVLEGLLVEEIVAAKKEVLAREKALLEGNNQPSVSGKAQRKKKNKGLTTPAPDYKCPRESSSDAERKALEQKHLRVQYAKKIIAAEKALMDGCSIEEVYEARKEALEAGKDVLALAAEKKALASVEYKKAFAAAKEESIYKAETESLSTVGYEALAAAGDEALADEALAADIIATEKALIEGLSTEEIHEAREESLVAEEKALAPAEYEKALAEARKETIYKAEKESLSTVSYEALAAAGDEALSAERVVYIVEEKAFETKKEALEAQRIAFEANREALAAQRVAFEAKKEVLAAQRTAFEAQRKALAAVREALAAEERALAAEERTLTAEREVLEITKKTLSTTKETFETDRKVLEKHRRTILADKEILGTDRAIYETEKELLTAEKALIALALKGDQGSG